jgi:hypothetical protein
MHTHALTKACSRQWGPRPLSLSSSIFLFSFSNEARICFFFEAQQCTVVLVQTPRRVTTPASLHHTLLRFFLSVSFRAFFVVPFILRPHISGLRAAGLGLLYRLRTIVFSGVNGVMRE